MCDIVQTEGNGAVAQCRHYMEKTATTRTLSLDRNLILTHNNVHTILHLMLLFMNEGHRMQHMFWNRDKDLTLAPIQHYYIPSLCCHTNGWSS